MRTKQQAIATIQRFKFYVLFLFPVLLALGKLCSFTLGPNYFSQKSNIFNVYFVKIGWLWTTAAFWAPYIMWPSQPIAGLNKPGLRGVVARYTAATVWWVLFTQWCFGSPIMDRIFIATGGSCVIDNNVLINGTSSRICRTRGGTWTGGHDPSGHYFLLLQSSMLLVQENLPYMYYLVVAENAVVPFTLKLTLALLTLWIWMFFITSIYFHSFTEKLTGLAFGYVEILFVYYLGEVFWWGALFGIKELDTEAVPPRAGSESASDATDRISST